MSKIVSLQVTAAVDMQQSYADTDTEDLYETTTCKSMACLYLELESGQKIKKEMDLCKNEVSHGELTVIPEKQLCLKVEESGIKTASVDFNVCSEGTKEVIFVSLENLRTITKVCLTQ